MRQGFLKRLANTPVARPYPTRPERQVDPQKRRLVRVTARVLVLIEEDEGSHVDPRRRGGYLVLEPPKVPRIILDGLATERERQEAEARCLLELSQAGY